jgi:hypothetical protein
MAGAYFAVGTLPRPLNSILDVLPFGRCVDLIRERLRYDRFPLGTDAILAIPALFLIGGLLIARAGVEWARRVNALGLE